MSYIPDRDRVKRREWKRINKQKHLYTNKKSLYKRKYGMTLEQVEEFKKVRNNRCDICGNERKKMCIDHIHDTKIVRGLLCHECNTLLGLAHDSKEVLTNAVKYLGGEYS